MINIYLFFIFLCVYVILLLTKFTVFIFLWSITLNKIIIAISHLIWYYISQCYIYIYIFCNMYNKSLFAKIYHQRYISPQQKITTTFIYCWWCFFPRIHHNINCVLFFIFVLINLLCNGIRYLSKLTPQNAHHSEATQFDNGRGWGPCIRFEPGGTAQAEATQGISTRLTQYTHISQTSHTHTRIHIYWISQAMQKRYIDR